MLTVSKLVNKFLLGLLALPYKYYFIILIIFQHPVAFKYSLHSIMQTDVHKVALKTVIIECKEFIILI
jgi:hypothetical protein